jgi:hypothetical protein
MLQGVEGEIGLAGGVCVAVDGDYTAFLVQCIAVRYALQGLRA